MPCCLGHHIPSKVTRKSVNTEFESFYQRLLLDISTIYEESVVRIKTQIRSKCEKYCNVKISFCCRQAIKRLSNNKDIVVLKQDKKGSVVIMNRSKYIKKFMTPLSYAKLKTTKFTIALLLRPIISNNRTATYKLVKYVS